MKTQVQKHSATLKNILKRGNKRELAFFAAYTYEGNAGQPWAVKDHLISLFAYVDRAYARLEDKTCDFVELAQLFDNEQALLDFVTVNYTVFHRYLCRFLASGDLNKLDALYKKIKIGVK